MHSTLPDELALVGRKEELAGLRRRLDRAAQAEPRAAFIRGESGVGKSRLVRAMADDARRRDWTVAVGRAYPVGAGVPYGIFTDALQPVIAQLEPGAVSVLTRGGEGDLGQIFPALRARGDGAERTGGSPSELKTRLFWNVTELLKGLSGRAPLLVVLEDLQWADEPSLELLHFIVRETRSFPVQILGTYNETHRERGDALSVTEQSLLRLDHLDVLRLEPLAPSDTAELITGSFRVDPSVTREFAALVHGWTRGNPFYLTETLKSLVESGRLHDREGTWLGWETDALDLPQSVRDAVLVRIGRLSESAAETARLAAVLGTRTRYEVLLVASTVDEHDLLAGLDELRRRGVLSEESEGASLFYTFQHPLVRETLYAELGRARSRVYHARIAEALERHYGGAALEHAEELAFHFSRAESPRLAGRAVRYRAVAGRRALGRFAWSPAADHLGDALERLARLDDAERAGLIEELGPLEEDLAHACQALGDGERGLALLESARAQARAHGDSARLLRVARRLSHLHFWTARYPEALDELDAALVLLGEAGPLRERASIRLVRGICLEQLGRADDAERELSAALHTAAEVGDAALLAKVHRALALNHLWRGATERVREHGEQAVALARDAGRGSVLFWSHWLMAVLEGLTGNAQAMAPRIEEAMDVATRLRSPHLRLWAAELSIEHASATGDWERGIALGEQSVVLARSLDQRTLLPRLLVWTALIHLGRGDLERARTLVDEAWEVSGAGGDLEECDVNTVVPAHTGRAACALAEGDYDTAIAFGEAALRLTDRSGYFVWAVHRLLPIMAEACLLKRDLDGALRIATRLKRDSERLSHRLGLAWADACTALVTWLGGDAERGARGLRAAAAQLEAIPFVWDAARVRRQLAGRLADFGDRDGALQELRGVHETFARLGAELELTRTREMFREIDARPPARGVVVGAGASALTSREIEIARLVADGKSNKAIGKALDIAPRTVSTHLSNIYRKVEVGSRAELTELVRTGQLPEG